MPENRPLEPCKAIQLLQEALVLLDENDMFVPGALVDQAIAMLDDVRRRRSV